MSKIDGLISFAEQLEKDRVEKESKSQFRNFAARHKMFSGVEFQEWVAQSIFFLEEQKPNSFITEELKQKYNQLENSTSYDLYEILLGTLKAVKNQ